MEKKCEHCSETFVASRKNQKYCSNSCRTMACYDRNNYQYKSGSYIKNEIANKVKGGFPIPSVKVDKISVAGIGNATAGHIIGEGLIAGGKRILFPDKVNATKKDINELKFIINQQNRTIEELRKLVEHAIGYK